MDGKAAVGFYWTLPVPWKGFTQLPQDVEEAGKASRTIRYQIERVRRYARENHYRLIHEGVFIELQPDRGSEQIAEPLDRLAELCRSRGAKLLYVDFSRVQKWRSHLLMEKWLGGTSIAIEPVSADPIMIDGKQYDPHQHFKDWRRRQKEWKEGKAARALTALKRANELREQGKTFRETAEILNREGVATLSGKLWTRESLRKFAKDKDTMYSRKSPNHS